jgi:hypothetical protein
MNDNGSICKVTVDGTDFSIYEPTPFDPIWYSHKINGPALRYEVGLYIQTGWIVWINGPYPAGIPDLSIARDWLIHELDPNEKYLADGGYCDGRQYSEMPNGLNNLDQRIKAVVRARHETVNRRLKQFGILSQRFRHSRFLHNIVFRAVANITQLSIMMDQPLFDIEYYDN